VPSPARAYHHGDLRRALVHSALDVIECDGLASLSLRDLARRVGVSHAAPVHHFGDKAGLLTAIAADGFLLLAEELQRTYTASGSFLEVGVAYVRFAVRHRAYFEVMYRPELYHADDSSLEAARQQARARRCTGHSVTDPMCRRVRRARLGSRRGRSSTG
jgi:AcrR family transcriptional regulator